MNDLILNKIEQELQYVDALRKTEELYHMMADIQHTDLCALCNGNCSGPLGVVLDIYFNLVGRHYWSCIKMTDKNDIWIDVGQNLPDEKDWKDTWCTLCKGTMDLTENIIGIPDCDHLFHEFCFYTHMNEVFKQNGARIVCPHPNCHHFLFIPGLNIVRTNTVNSMIVPSHFPTF